MTVSVADVAGSASREASPRSGFYATYLRFALALLLLRLAFFRTLASSSFATAV
jgi:hypothetical protein